MIWRFRFSYLLMWIIRNPRGYVRQSRMYSWFIDCVVLTRYSTDYYFVLCFKKLVIWSIRFSYLLMWIIRNLHGYVRQSRVCSWFIEYVAHTTHDVVSMVYYCLLCFYFDEWNFLCSTWILWSETMVIRR